MTSGAVTELLHDLLNEIGRCQTDDAMTTAELDPEGRLLQCRADSFRDRGVLSLNDGIMLRLNDGTEFQVTIVRSR